MSDSTTLDRPAAPPQPIDLPRDRAATAEWIAATFPNAYARDHGQLSDWIGGRDEALRRLAAVEPTQYGRTRNHLAGNVTRLSAYIRHGCVSLAEVRDDILSRVSPAKKAYKLVQELAWRDFYQRVHFKLGDGIWDDSEPYKTGWHAEQYERDLPDDIARGQTDHACINLLIDRLHTTGYLHNHARMWLASYVVHWRRVRWQAGAQWFLTHLVDGDPASNNLSWQWVASTFGHKAYIFNRGNMEKYADDELAAALEQDGRTDFDGSYGQIANRLFPRGQISVDGNDKPDPLTASLATPPNDAPGRQRPLLWIHDDAIREHSPLRKRYPDAPAAFIFDGDRYDRLQWSTKRIAFVAECVAEAMTGELDRTWQGETVECLKQAASDANADAIVTTRTPDPTLNAAIEQLRDAGIAVDEIPDTPFIDTAAEVSHRRFSRYWKKAEKAAFQRSDTLFG